MSTVTAENPLGLTCISICVAFSSGLGLKRRALAPLDKNSATGSAQPSGFCVLVEFLSACSLAVCRADHLSIGLFRHPEPWDSSSTMVETHTWKCRQGPLPCWEGVELVVRNQVPHLRVGYTGSSVVTGPHWGVSKTAEQVLFLKSPVLCLHT